MRNSSGSTHRDPEPREGRYWFKILSDYRELSVPRSSFEIAVNLGPFVALWALALWSLEVRYWLTFAISLVNACFLLRLFAIQHDCGHGSFFKNKVVGDWLGRSIGVLTLTPYDVWRRAHTIHHGSSGNLGRRELGEIHSLTVNDYRLLKPLSRYMYRLYRNPIVLFGLRPSYIFLLEYRLPLGLTAYGKDWISAMATNAAIISVLTFLFWRRACRLFC